ADSARLEADLDALRRGHAELQRDLEQAQGQLDVERLAMRGETMRLGEKLDEALRRAEQLEKERDHAVARLGDAEDRSRAEVDAVAVELERAVQQYDAADQRGRDLQAGLETLGAEADSLRQSQAQLRKELAAREQEVQAARDAAREAQNRLSSAQSD